MSAFSLPAPIILGRAKTFMEYVISLLGPMWSGAQVTLKLFVITMALSIPLGLVLALVRISRLRRKLEDDPQDPKIIKTVYGAGYLLCGTVEWMTG